ncbi:RNA polymerase II mediator complex subunit [Vermiconidia calcicola]|uniref:RNA polymerase II mediator complex subunit n=1 Tax=Vermiconidia calcicola TaxID=1690605 RepID=A0ACC3MB52_9PEZI|nr:RNA polymerase II mediator complex subunit [Vermiconidia calcicola]
MADRLTQLQDCLDDLLTQMYASLSYLQTRHPYGTIEGQPSQAPQPAPPSQNTALPNGTSIQPQSQPAARTANEDGGTTENDRPPTPPPEDPATFDAAMRELARDLVLKEQQVEYLIQSLPGIGSSELDQERRMRELEKELREVEGERERAEGVREGLEESLGRVLVGGKRIP